MTEEEWLASSDPFRMLDVLRGKASGRKFRLFACACCRRIWNLLRDKRSRKAVECSEQFADGNISKEQLSAARKEAEEAYWPGILKHRGLSPDEERGVQRAADAAKFAASATARAMEHFYKMRRSTEISLWAELPKEGPSSPQAKLQRSDLLREIFGNPFRPIALSSTVLAWNEGVAVRLAQAAYEQRQLPAGTLDNGLLAILANALEEAGCTDQDILGHCRRPGRHVRGCWVVDMILRKS